ncbi:MAG: hemolysin family protein [Anaerolineae bacterium]
MLEVMFKILAVFTLIFINGFFAAAEFALVSTRRTRIEQLAAEGNVAALAARRLLDNPDRFIAAVQLGVTMASLGLGWIGEPAIASLIEPLLEMLPSAPVSSASSIVGTALSFGLITFFCIVLGEQVPKTIAIRYGEQTSMTSARPMEAFSFVFRPFIFILDRATFLTLRLLGLQPITGHRSVLSLEELKQVVRESQEGGILEAEHEEVVQRAFRFANRRVHEAMIPRPDVVGVEKDTTIKDFLQIFSRTSHSRFPVYEEDMDNIVGIIAIKDVLRALANEPGKLDSSIEGLIRPALFVPESRLIGDLMAEMRDHQIQMAIIIDEYGGTAGVVTLEELVEEIVGRLSDELVVAPSSIEAIDEHTFQVNAQLRIDEVNEGLNLELPESEEYETLAGFILYLLRHIPKEGETLRYRDLRFVVNKMKGPKIEEVQIIVKNRTLINIEKHR